MRNKSLSLKFTGRLKVIAMLSSGGDVSLFIGSGKTRFADLNLDVNSKCNPDVVASATHLPFRNGVFDLVLFTDVIEHLPKGRELGALKEIARVLQRHRKVVFSCPNNVLLFTFLDPAFWVKGHRHYKFDEIRTLFEKAGLKVLTIFSSGGIWACLNNLWYCLITYPLRKLLSIEPPIPSLSIREDIEYCTKKKRGYTVFAIARKEQ